MFDQVVKTVAERLRPLGFSRRGTVLRIMGPGTSGLIEFQRSTKSSQDKLLFTVNLGVVCGDLLEASAADLPKSRAADAHVRQRIGMLLPDRPDKWWEIAAHTDADALSREIADLILDKAVPYIRQYLNVDSILELWESGQSPGLTNGQRVNLLAALKAKRQGGGA
jgi:hypothetical protein